MIDTQAERAASETTWRKKKSEVDQLIRESTETRKQASDIGVVPMERPRACLVLVLDDDDTIRSIVSQVAEDEGLEPLQACDVTGAIDVLSSAKDLRRAIIDWRLKDGTAATLLATLRHRGIDTLLLTGYVDEAVEQCDLTWLSVMEKPVPIDRLREWMRRRNPPSQEEVSE